MNKIINAFSKLREKIKGENIVDNLYTYIEKGTIWVN